MVSAFVTRIDTTKTGAASLIYSTYLGGNSTIAVLGDSGNSIVIDIAQNAFVGPDHVHKFPHYRQCLPERG